MIVVNTDFITGKNLATISLVSGGMVQSKHIGKDLAAGFKTMVGGELTGYTEMLEEAREMAVSRMISKAEAMGADGIINLHFSSSAIIQGAAEVLAYGTAVKFI